MSRVPAAAESVVKLKVVFAPDVRLFPAASVALVHPPSALAHSRTK